VQKIRKNPRIETGLRHLVIWSQVHFVVFCIRKNPRIETGLRHLLSNPSRSARSPGSNQKEPQDRNWIETLSGGYARFHGTFIRKNPRIETGLRLLSISPAINSAASYQKEPQDRNWIETRN